LEEVDMTLRSFLRDPFGVSLLYDAVLFLVMVSLAGVVLLPTLHSPIAVTSSVEKHREEVVDDALQTLLVSRVDQFDYLFCGEQVDGLATSLGINTSSEGLYSVLTHWLLAHEQRHKTYATLLAEDLGCQFSLPQEVMGVDRLNCFTTAFDEQLQNETQQVLSGILGDKYGYNLTALWHPLRTVRFGGEFSIGEPPPQTDTSVARSILSMPYLPVFQVGNRTVVLTKQSLTHALFSNDLFFRRSSVPAIANITLILENYTNGRPPYDTREIAMAGVRENLSVLTYGFLLQGIQNETKVTVFPGIVHLTLSSGFERLKNLTTQLLDKALDESFGAVVRSIDGVFSGLNSSEDNPLSSMILEGFNTTFHLLVNGSFGSFDEVFAACEMLITEQVTEMLSTLVDPLIDAFVNMVFDSVDMIQEFATQLIDWLFDSISLSTGEVTLTIWAVRV
jgi:hypothetical protein